MRRLLLITALMLGMCGLANAELTLTSVFDGASSTPRGVELYVGETGDYSGWTLDLEFNAATTFTVAHVFDATVFNEGDFIFVTSTPADPTVTSAVGTVISNGTFVINGDDRVRLTDGTNVIDQYGDSGVDGTGEAWEYLDSFAYRNDGTSSSGNFEIGDWTIAPINSLDAGNGPLGGTLGTFVAAVPEPSTLAFASLIGMGIGLVRRRK
jgi:hypothetical protein